MQPSATAWTATLVIPSHPSPRSSKPSWKKPPGDHGHGVLQAESEVLPSTWSTAAPPAEVCMTSSRPRHQPQAGGISYMAGAELPALIVNVQRGGPGLGTIQPSQADYFQTVKGGGHGDYKLITLAPSSVQEMADFVGLAFDLAFKYRNPAMILSDGVIGQMMEKVKLPAWRRRRTEQEIREQCPWATLGKTSDRKPNIITSLELDSAAMEKNNERFQAKYREVEATEVRYEEVKCDDADYLLVAFGSAARICLKSIDLARQEGIKVGLLRPITLWPFPSEILHAYGSRVKGILTVELNAGQMVEDVRLAVNGQIPVAHYGRLGGIVPTPDGVLAALKEKIVH